MRTVTIIIEATHNENSDAALAGALARFAAKNLNTLGYRVQDIVCSDKEYRLPEEPRKRKKRQKDNRWARKLKETKKQQRPPKDPSPSPSSTPLTSPSHSYVAGCWTATSADN